MEFSVFVSFSPQSWKAWQLVKTRVAAAGGTSLHTISDLTAERLQIIPQGFFFDFYKGAVQVSQHH